MRVLTRGLGSFWPGAGALVLVTFVCYYSSLNNSFHYDDSHSIVGNHHIRELSAVPSFFIDSGTFSNEVAMAMYRPLLQSSYAVNYALGGYQVVGYRLVNLLAHALCVLIVLAFVRKLGVSGIQAWFIVAVFAVHPINSQLVNYISSRSELFGVLGVTGALYVHGFSRVRWTAGVLYALALLCKSAAVVFLPLVFLLELARGTELKRAVWLALPYAGLTVGYLILITMEGFLPRSLGQDVRPMDEQIYTQTKALVYYLKLVAMPIGLSVEHAFTEVNSLTDGTVFFSALLLVTVVTLAVRSVHVLPTASLGVLWFLTGLSLTFVFPLNVLVNEHRLYLPFIGLLVLLGGVMRHTRIRGPVNTALSIALLLICVSHTQARNEVWLNEHSLWSDAVAKAPGMFRVQSNLGLALYERGELPAARQALERSIEINPSYGKSWSNLGLVYEDLGRLYHAERAFDQARRLNPELSGSYNNLGRLYSRLGRSGEAVPLLETAVRRDSRNIPAWINLGRAYQHQDRLVEAEEAYRRATTLDAGSAPAFNNLGLLLGELGRREEAHAALRMAVAIDSSYTEAAVNLQLHELKDQGVDATTAYRRVLSRYPRQVKMWKALGGNELRLSNWVGAAAAYEEVVRLNPADVEAFESLAVAYRNAGRAEAAIETYRKALAIQPRNVRVHNNLAAALAALGDVESALSVTRRALEVEPANKRAAANLAKLLEVLQSRPVEGLYESP